jgi:hypothetical protein
MGRGYGHVLLRANSGTVPPSICFVKFATLRSLVHPSAWTISLLYSIGPRQRERVTFALGIKQRATRSAPLLIVPVHDALVKRYTAAPRNVYHIRQRRALEGQFADQCSRPRKGRDNIRTKE